jgi:hypothetical protein
MRKDLLRRIAQLEQRSLPKEIPPFVVIVDAIGAERRKSLADNERIVEDWFRNDHNFVLASERITSVPGDEGRRCMRNGYLEDVIREAHLKCYYRARGVCNICVGLRLF